MFIVKKGKERKARASVFLKEVKITSWIEQTNLKEFTTRIRKSRYKQWEEHNTMGFLKLVQNPVHVSSSERGIKKRSAKMPKMQELGNSS